jgi:hypothetical protein
MATTIGNGEAADATIAANFELEAGRHFRADNGIIWKVHGMAVTTDALPHVMLIGVTDPTARKVISVDALLDRRLFSAMDAA